MKSLQQKYEEAKARATKGLEEYVRKLPLESTPLAKWANHTLESAKTHLGIRKTDTSFDTTIRDVIDNAASRLKKATKKIREEAKAATEKAEAVATAAAEAAKAEMKKSKKVKNQV